ncbi:hypothetical protein COH32_08485 [Neisseria meningitidis]|nr:hypothetical protein COH32_08485 [Neisseria meningitidis]
MLLSLSVFVGIIANLGVFFSHFLCLNDNQAICRYPFAGFVCRRLPVSNAADAGLPISGRIFGICPMPAVEYPFYPQKSRCLHAKLSTSTWTHSTHR